MVYDSYHTDKAKLVHLKCAGNTVLMLAELENEEGRGTSSTSGMLENNTEKDCL